MSTEEYIQLVGGPLDGYEFYPLDYTPEFHFPRMPKSLLEPDAPVVIDVYVQLANTLVYVYKGMRT